MWSRAWYGSCGVRFGIAHMVLGLLRLMRCNVWFGSCGVGFDMPMWSRVWYGSCVVGFGMDHVL